MRYCVYTLNVTSFVQNLLLSAVHSFWPFLIVKGPFAPKTPLLFKKLFIHLYSLVPTLIMLTFLLSELCIYRQINNHPTYSITKTQQSTGVTATAMSKSVLLGFQSQNKSNDIDGSAKNIDNNVHNVNRGGDNDHCCTGHSGSHSSQSTIQ